MIVGSSLLTWHQAIFPKRSEIKPRFPDVGCYMDYVGGGDETAD